MRSKNNLLQSLQILEDTINYSVIDGQVFHNRSGLFDSNFLLNRTVHFGTDDIILIYNSDTNEIHYLAVNPAFNITFESYKVIDGHLHLHYNDIEYVVKNGGKLIFESSNFNPYASRNGDYGEHMIVYRGDSKPFINGTVVSFRLVFAGYPKNDVDYPECGFGHSFDYIEKNDGQFKFVAKAYLDSEFNLVCDYVSKLTADTVKQKLEIYRNGFDLLSYAAFVYYPRTDYLSFFINDNGDLDFSANFYFVHKLKDLDAFDDIEIISQNKEIFSSPFFENFIKCFNKPFKDYLIKFDCNIDVDIQTIDDLVRYKYIADMYTI